MEDLEGNLIAGDMPKLQSPFKREHKEVNGSKHYVVSPEVDLDYMWVFEDKEVYAMEKLDGTNVSIVMRDGELKEVWNRKNMVSKKTGADTWENTEGFNHVTEGVNHAIDSGEINKVMGTNGQYFGELIGLGIQKNPMDLDHKTWVPFETYGKEYLVYPEWADLPKDFDNISNFMKNIHSRYFKIHHGKDEYAEGIVLYRPSTGERAKLRRDMFDWWIVENPGRINKHVNTYNKAPKKQQPEGMQGEFSILSKKFKQNLVTKEEYEIERDNILKKYQIR